MDSNGSRTQRPAAEPDSGAGGGAPARTLAVPAPGPPPGPDLGMTVHESFDGLDPLREEWNALAAELGASVLLSFETCHVWWRHYGDGRRLRILAFRQGGRLVAVLPMLLEVRGVPPLRVRAARVLTSDSTPSVLALPVRPEHARSVYAAALRHLTDEVRCDEVRFAPASAEDPTLADLRAAAESAVPGCRLLERVSGVHTTFDVPGSFEEYLARLPSNHRTKYRRGMQALRRERNVESDALRTPGDLSGEFDAFRRLHDAQWSAEGRLGHFGDWPGSDAYHRELCARLSGEGRAILLRLRADGEAVSYYLCYALGTTLHWFLPARSTRPDLEKHRIGQIGLVNLLEFAAGAGFRRVEGGPGHYPYKVQLGARESEVRSVRVVRAGAWTAARLAVLERTARLLDLVYYRIWYLRVAPRAGLRRKPLWRTWIRSRP